MSNNSELIGKVLMAARDIGIASMLFRNTMARKFGLNLTESLCLTILGINGSSTPKELANFTGLTTGAITTLLDRLEKREFIKRLPNTNDRRGVIIEIHKNYVNQAQEMVKGIQKAHLDLVASYTDAELEIIIVFLQKFTNNMQSASRAIEKDDK